MNKKHFIIKYFLAFVLVGTNLRGYYYNMGDSLSDLFNACAMFIYVMLDHISIKKKLEEDRTENLKVIMISENEGHEMLRMSRLSNDKNRFIVHYFKKEVNSLQGRLLQALELKDLQDLKSEVEYKYSTKRNGKIEFDSPEIRQFYDKLLFVIYNTINNNKVWLILILTLFKCVTYYLYGNLCAFAIKTKREFKKLIDSPEHKIFEPQLAY